MLKKSGLVLIVLILFLVPVVNAGFFGWLKEKLTGRATSVTSVANVTVGNTAPTILNVSAVANKDPVEAGANKITFETYVNDVDGSGNIQAVMAEFQEGNIRRVNRSCYNIGDFNSTSRRFQCTVDLYWFDSNTAWTVNATVYDAATATGSGTNTSTSFTFNSLKAFVMGVSSGSSTGLTWPTVSLRDTNTASNNDPLLLNNTGNANISASNINVTGYNLIGETTNTQYLPVVNMSVHFTTGSSVECTGGIALTNATATIVTSANMTKGNYTVNDGTTGQEQLYFCLKNVLSSTSTAQQSYSTAGGSAWTVTII